MNYFYSAGVMGYGNGRFWHKKYNFPKFPIVTKTLTIKPKIGCPFAIIKSGNTIWNKVSLHNIGIKKWYSIERFHTNDVIISIAGTDLEIANMVTFINVLQIKGVINFIGTLQVKGIELNFSCPNVRSFKNKNIPSSRLPLYLKLNYLQDPYDYDLDKIMGIRLNAVPKFFGGISGKMARQYNWPWIKKFNKEGLNVAGCSCNIVSDIKYMEDIGCREVGLGSIVLTNPKLVESLGSF